MIKKYISKVFIFFVFLLAFAILIYGAFIRKSLFLIVVSVVMFLFLYIRDFKKRFMNKKGFLFLLVFLVFISGCVNSEQDINKLLENPKFKAQIYELLENSCLNITKGENDYLVKYYRCGEYEVMNSSQGLVLVKPIERTETTTSTTTTTVERKVINISDLDINETRSYL